jgi:hypothetical protein
LDLCHGLYNGADQCAEEFAKGLGLEPGFVVAGFGKLGVEAGAVGGQGLGEDGLRHEDPVNPYFVFNQVW